MQNYFKEFARMYPNLKIDIWVDEGRGKNIFRRRASKNNYILYDWLDSCQYFNRIYKNVFGFFGLLNFLNLAKKEKYPIIISLGTLNRHRYAKYCCKISKDGFKVGFVGGTKKINFIKNHYLKKLNEKIDLSNLQKKFTHISDVNASWFQQLFGVKCDKAQRKPFINISQEWIIYAKLKFLKWNINKQKLRNNKIVFINAIAKNIKRCWSMEKVAKFISILSLKQDFYNANYIINVMPDQYKEFENTIKNYSTKRIFLFTVESNFFQLPSIISLCDLVISVETSVMHFASALNIPLVALMRQKSPEWIPFDGKFCIVFSKKRKDWIKDILIDDVVKTTTLFVKNQEFTF
ncbi:glycosyltransferase family 9 protein [Candidatus Babeliales bacterium]|nr:glycosyltransferase family 9 protein [Candidatus Babeliales bacterium]